MESLQIRELKKTDRELIEEFFHQMSPETNTFFNPHNCNYKEIMKFFDGMEATEDHRRWIGVADGKIAGYVFLWHTLSGVPELGIVLAEDMRGRHLSKKFMDTAVNWCRDNGKGGVLLTTNKENTVAQILYEKYGFEKIGVTTWEEPELLYIYRFGELTQCWN